MFKKFLTVDKHYLFKFFVRQTTSTVSGMEIRPATLKIPLLVISKLLTLSSNCGLRSSASQHGIVQLLI